MLLTFVVNRLAHDRCEWHCEFIFISALDEHLKAETNHIEINVGRLGFVRESG